MNLTEVNIVATENQKVDANDAKEPAPRLCASRKKQ